MNDKNTVYARYGIAILSGGEGRRMGYRKKEELIWEGQTFAERILKELYPLGFPIFWSVRQSADWHPHGTRAVADLETGEGKTGVGPVGGLLSCLKASGLEGLFVLPCDMPRVRRAMVEKLLEQVRPEDDALIWQTRDGRLQTLCGFYRKSCIPMLERQISERNYRLKDFISRISARVLTTSQMHLPELWFSNINSREDYERLTAKAQPPVLAVSGSKNTGKTTLLECLVRGLSERGIRTAVIKHDGHEFVPDVPGTDTFRLREAGAEGTLIYSDSQYMLVKQKTGSMASDFISFFPEADIILLEGQKNSDYPKIEVLRQEISRSMVCRQSTVLMCVTDGGWIPDNLTVELPVCDFNDYDMILETAVSLIDSRSEKMQ